MDEFLNYDYLSKTDVILSLLINIPFVLYWVFKLAAALTNFSRISNVKSGIYNGYWIDPIKKEINCEVLRLKKTIRGLRIIPLYKHKTFHDYKVLLKPYKLNHYIFGAVWSGKEDTIYRGYSLFLYDIENDTFIGKWIGPKSNGHINSGDWHMAFFTDVNSLYINYLKLRKFYTLREMFFPSTTILTHIIAKHKTYPFDTFKVENIELRINENSFIPTLGKISIPFIKYIQTKVNSSDAVLDIGTGTGFYPIYLAKNIRCNVKGIDIGEKTITLARSNAIQNEVSSLVEFDVCKEDELFFSISTKEKFDFIIANLPFTRVAKSYQSRNSNFYSSFAGSVNLLEQLILGSQYHIKPNGKLLFCYGESGYRDLLESLVKISSWGYLNIVKTITEKDETFYIMELELSERVKNYYSELNEMQQKLK
ncbi:methyltransferase domain-containing protein [bacterium]|nr:MAG: methyltransferase domain-containing protein [bacterium]